MQGSRVFRANGRDLGHQTKLLRLTILDEQRAGTQFCPVSGTEQHRGVLQRSGQLGPACRLQRDQRGDSAAGNQ